jgi:hypothetical protein
MSGEVQQSTAILQHLIKRKLPTWGFTIYRCCAYDDNARWEQFMDKLKTIATTQLDLESDGLVIKEKLVWDVKEDPALEGASKDEIRQYEPILSSHMKVVF